MLSIGRILNNSWLYDLGPGATLQRSAAYPSAAAELKTPHVLKAVTEAWVELARLDPAIRYLQIAAIPSDRVPDLCGQYI